MLGFEILGSYLVAQSLHQLSYPGFRSSWYSGRNSEQFPGKWKFRPPSLIRVIESRRMKWAVRVEYMGMGVGQGEVVYTEFFL